MTMPSPLPNRAEIASHLDLSERTVSDLLSEWGLKVGEVSLDDARVRYIRKLRASAAGRAHASDESLVAGRAKLAWEQAERVARQNAIARRELAPASVIAEVLAKAGTKVRRILETIPAEIRRREVGVSSETVDAVSAIVANALNSAAAIRFDDLGVDIPDEPEADGQPDESPEA